MTPPGPMRPLPEGCGPAARWFHEYGYLKWRGGDEQDWTIELGHRLGFTCAGVEGKLGTWGVCVQTEEGNGEWSHNGLSEAAAVCALAWWAAAVLEDHASGVWVVPGNPAQGAQK